jgi:hypothetical protein
MLVVGIEEVGRLVLPEREEAAGQVEQGNPCARAISA